MKNFRDYAALSGLISKISEAIPPDDQIKTLSELLVEQLDFTVGNAWAYARTVLASHNAESAACISTNATKLTGNWLGMTQSGVVSGYLDTTSYTWWFRPDLTFEYRRQRCSGYVSPFGSNGSAASSSGYAGV